MQNKHLLLKEIRGVHKTQSDFAKELGVSKSLYAKYESGERELSKKFIYRLKSKFPNLDTNIFFNDKHHVKCDNVA